MYDLDTINDNSNTNLIDIVHSSDYIDINHLNIPSYFKEIAVAELTITKLSKLIKNKCSDKYITNELHIQYFDEVVKILDYVGKLSIPAFSIFNELESLYFIKYKNKPHLAKKLWLEHYDYIHHPYTILKNRCHRLLDDLDVAYQRKFKTYPPNWNL